MTENQEIKVLPKRCEIPEALKWQVNSIFEDDGAWEVAFRDCQDLLDEASGFAGTLGKGPRELLAFLDYETALCQKLDKIYLYAALKQDEDNGNSVYQGLKERVEGLAVKIGAALAFVNPEILAIPAADLSLWLQNPELAVYDRYLGEITRMAPHIRSASEEEILALAGDICGAPRTIFGMLNNADLKFPVITNEDGARVEITHGNYIVLMESQDRQVREKAFHALYSTYAQNKNSLAAMLAANVKKNIFGAKVRNYPSALSAALFGEEIPVKVYDRLIEGVRGNLPHFFKYLELRKKALGVDELHLYDIYTPLFKEKQRHIPYEEAVETVLAALAPLGADYVADAKKAFSEGWVDVMENQGKTSGAYSSGVYGSKPFILLNYQFNLNSVFTLAHELGHSMHSYYSNNNQPYIYSDYEIFVAEVASTVNETLLLKYLLNKETDREKRLLLVNYYLDQFRGTVFRQTMFAEFEKLIHQQSEAGLPLSCQYFQETYYKLNCDYFGDKMVVDQEIDMEWSRIPHFYRSFYVYKYATGFSAATALVEGILSQGLPAVAKYRSFLAGGCSDTPINLLRRAGVDMEDPETLNRAFKVFQEMLVELEALIG